MKSPTSYMYARNSRRMMKYQKKAQIRLQPQRLMGLRPMAIEMKLRTKKTPSRRPDCTVIDTFPSEQASR
jgi:hypothetical protein